MSAPENKDSRFVWQPGEVEIVDHGKPLPDDDLTALGFEHDNSSGSTVIFSGKQFASKMQARAGRVRRS